MAIPKRVRRLRVAVWEIGLGLACLLLLAPNIGRSESVEFDSASRSVSSAMDANVSGLPPDSDNRESTGPEWGTWTSNNGVYSSWFDPAFGEAYAQSSQPSGLGVDLGNPNPNVAVFAEPAPILANSAIVDPGSPSELSAYGASNLEMTFTVSEPADMELYIFLSAWVFNLQQFGNGLASAEATSSFDLCGVRQGCILSESLLETTPRGDRITFEEAYDLVLEADTYTFHVEATADTAAREDAAAQVESGFGVILSVVPEPGAGLAGGVALLTLLALRRWSPAAPSCGSYAAIGGSGN